MAPGQVDANRLGPGVITGIAQLLAQRTTSSS